MVRDRAQKTANSDGGSDQTSRFWGCRVQIQTYSARGNPKRPSQIGELNGPDGPRPSAPRMIDLASRNGRSGVDPLENETAPNRSSKSASRSLGRASPGGVVQVRTIWSSPRLGRDHSCSICPGAAWDASNALMFKQPTRRIKVADVAVQRGVQNPRHPIPVLLVGDELLRHRSESRRPS